MALKQAFSSQSGAPVRLRQITTTPSTEDLRYVLATATQHKKPAELPFKNLYNGLTFMVRVVPATGQIAPRWTFERCEANGPVHLWTRETNEVIMIQGKIKIEANYTGEGAMPEPVDQSQQGTTGSQPIVMGNPEISAYDLPSMGAKLDQSAGSGASPSVGTGSGANYESFTGSAGAIFESGPSGVMSVALSEQKQDTDSTSSGSHLRVERWSEVEDWSGGWAPSPVDASSSSSSAGASSAADAPADDDKMAQSGTCSGSNWLFTEGHLAPCALPPPVALSADVVKNYLGALTNPATGLIRHSPFEFFLMRDLGYVKKCGIAVSLLIFDFGSEEQSKLPAEAHATLCDILKDYVSPMEICAQLKTGEYAILLCGYSINSATEVAQNLSSKIKESADLFASCADLRALAIGIGTVPDMCSDAGTLLAVAIAAKQQARKAGKDLMVFTA